MDEAFWTRVLAEGWSWPQLLETLPPALASTEGPLFGYVRLLPGDVAKVRYLSSSGSLATLVLELDSAGDVLGVVATFRPVKPNPGKRATAPTCSRPEVVRAVLSAYAKAEGRGQAPRGKGLRRQRPQISHEEHLASLAAALAEIPKPWIVPPAPSTVLPTISELDELGF